ncbi:MAG: ABC transporter ATP-binding protein [Bacilli bacterium]
MVNVLRKLGWFFRENRGRYVVALTLLMVLNVIEVAPPALLGNAINDMNQGTMTPPLLLQTVGLYGGLAVVSYFFTFVWMFQLFGGGNVLQRTLRSRLMAQFLRMTPAFFEKNRTGDLMARATNDLNAVAQTAGFGILTLIDSTTYSAVILLAMGTLISWKLTLLSLLPLPVIAWLMTKYGKVLHERFTIAQDSFGDMNDRVLETIAGIRVVRAYVQEEAENRRFADTTEDVYRKNVAVARIDALFEPTIKILVGASYLTGLGYGTYMVFESQLTLGQLTTFNIYLGMLIWPMLAIGELINIMQRGNASLDRVMETLAQQPDVEDAPDLADGLRTAGAAGAFGGTAPAGATGAFGGTGGPVATGLAGATGATGATGAVRAVRAVGKWRGAMPESGVLAAGPGCIEFDSVTFRYPLSANDNLRELTLTIRPGETLGIVGRTGSGKSTLIRQLLREYPTGTGSLRIGGAQIEQIPLAQLHGWLGYAPQDAMLFSRTVEENVRFGAPDASDARMAQALEMACFVKDVELLPNGLRTLVGEKGVSLSGGQKQRIALARALIVNPEILLLDDAMSAVDARTEAHIVAAIRRTRQGRTTLIATHRLSAVSHANWIVVLDDGRIVEQGTHEVLLCADGWYREQYLRQRTEEGDVDSEYDSDVDEAPAPAHAPAPGVRV